MAASKDIARLSFAARYFFCVLLCELDDQGRVEYSPKKLAGALFPHDENVESSAIREWVLECCESGVLVHYSVGEYEYLCAPNFSKHQTINKPTPSSNPCPKDANSVILAGVLPEDYRSATTPLLHHSRSTTVPEIGNRKKEIGNRKKEKQAKEKPLATVADNPPTLEEIKSYALSEFNLNGDFIQQFFSKNTEQGWQDRHGKPYTNWKNLMRSWVSRLSDIQRDQYTPKPKPNLEDVHR